MPIGVIVNSISVLAGGILGSVIGKHLQTETKKSLNMVLGLCSFGMGIMTVIRMVNMPAVVLAVIVGTLAGLVIHLGSKTRQAAALLTKNLSHTAAGGSDTEKSMEREEMLLTAIVLFCSSGTGIYGSLISGISDDHSILLTKSILDLFTAMIFACTIGIAISFIAIPQFIILYLLFILSGLLSGVFTSSVLDDFRACGGLIMLATGFRMLKLVMFPIADMVPAMVLIVPFSLFWSRYIVPLVS